MNTSWRVVFVALLAMTFMAGYALGHRTGQRAACKEACDSEDVYVPSPGQCFCDGDGNTMYRGW